MSTTRCNVSWRRVSLGAVLASVFLWQSIAVRADQASSVASATATPAKSASEDRLPAIGRLAHEALKSANPTIDRIIVLGSASYAGREPQDELARAAAGIQQGMGMDMQVVPHLIVTTGPDRLFAGLGLANGSQAANADVLLDAAKQGPLAALVLDDGSLTECWSAIQFILKNRIANPVRVILAVNISEKTLARYRNAGVPLIVLPEALTK